MRKITRQNRRVMAALQIARDGILAELDHGKKAESGVLQRFGLDTTDAGLIEKELRSIDLYLQHRQVNNGIIEFTERKRRGEL